jgi:hypothetical protein
VANRPQAEHALCDETLRAVELNEGARAGKDEAAISGTSRDRGVRSACRGTPFLAH